MKMRTRPITYRTDTMMPLLTFGDVFSHLWVPHTGFVVLILYATNILNVCESTENVIQNSVINSTRIPSLLSLTSQSLDQSGDDDRSDKARQLVTRIYTNPKAAKQNNDVIRKVSLDTTTPGSHNYTTVATPRPYTRRAVYIRGHLLRHPPPAKRKKFHPPEAAGRGLFQAPNSIHLQRVQNFRDGTDWDGSRHKRKQKENERFHNYKLLYGTLKDPGNRGEQTEFYAWVFGASMLGVIALTTLVSGLVFCFCGNRARRAARARHARRPQDTAGEYQRVESVSSIVDNGSENTLETIYEEQTDNVTII